MKSRRTVLPANAEPALLDGTLVNRHRGSTGLLCARILPAVLAPLLLVVAGLPWATGRGSVAQAGHGHPISTGNHLARIHWAAAGHSSVDEDVCYNSYDEGVLSDSALSSKLYSSIFLAGGWDLTGNGRIDLWISSSPCPDYPNDYGYDLRFEARANGNGGYSTAYGTYPLYSNGQILHYGQFLITLKTSHINGTVDSQHATINHEMGHAFGLKDPPDASGDPSENMCTRGGWYFGSSVMHQFATYGCPSGYIWTPTVYDKDTVIYGEMPLH